MTPSSRSLAARVSARSTAIILALLLTGCARNAFLELQLDLPLSPDERYANIRVVTADTPFEQVWEGDNPIPADRLSKTQRSSQRISVEASDTSETKRVRVKVRFCKSPTCTDLKDDSAPEAWLELERAFYIGERTSFPWVIGCIPNTPDVATPVCDVKNRTTLEVAKCKVAGCRAGAPTSSYCVGPNHFCEQ